MIDEAWAGSSPLTRGKPSCTACPARQSRLIPAHAGKTSTIARVRALPTAHPRSRGENLQRVDADHAASGSSPLTRGKLDGEGMFFGRWGLIPAHAGKTPPQHKPSRPRWAHPRSRGENGRARSRVTGRVGSSPLTRGKQRDQCRRRRAPGLIPAHAGKTQERVPGIGYVAAHPRSRGENEFGGLGVDGCLRLIPAHAGKTRSGSQGPGRPRAHPRSRGENWLIPVVRGASAGSSPLTRGKPLRRVKVLIDNRLIPAHAGKTHH